MRAVSTDPPPQSSPPQPPPVPANAPAAIHDFVAGRRDDLVLTSGRLDWMPLPPLLNRGLLGKALTPTTRIEAGDRADAVVAVKWPVATLTLRVAVDDGQLVIEPVGARHRLLTDIYRGIDDWTARTNRWVVHTGRVFTALRVTDGAARLETGSNSPISSEIDDVP